MEDVLATLVGRQLGSVEFVQDYVQFHFDGPTLTVFEYPAVEDDRNRYTEGLTGYRDALCGLIARKVRATATCDGEELRLEFEGGAHIVVPLHREDDNPEVAMFQDPHRRIAAVW